MMELDLEKDEISLGTNIKIIGVGGGGGNAVNTMIENQLDNVEFIVANTNIIDLKKSRAQIKIQLGKETTKGLGTGANPELGKQSAEESREDIAAALQGADMVFITAGMGGGTGTGAAPIIASIAREMEILTIAVVTKPFKSEAKKRMVNAEAGIKEFENNVDTLIIIPNEKLNELYSELTVIDAFRKADNILYEAAKASTEIINYSGYISVDFADVKTVMTNKGYAMMGTGTGEGEDRAEKAAKEAMSNPLMSDLTLKNAEGILINITCNENVKMHEFAKISQTIIDEAGEDGEIIQGIIFDEKMEDKIKVTLIATGLKHKNARIFEMEDIRKQKIDTSANISDVFERIRKSENNNIDKKADSKGKAKRDVPTFFRKFQND